MNKIGTTIKNTFMAILKGELLHRLDVGKYFVHILYTFFIFAVIIWISLRIDMSMARVEENAAKLKELEIINTQKTYRVVSLSRRSTVNEMLREMGSEVQEATQPSTVIPK